MTEFKRDKFEGVSFFIGGEVELTPAFSKKTLFVVGPQQTSEIVNLAKKNTITHIFLTANRCFDKLIEIDGIYMVGQHPATYWARQTQELLDMGYTVSVDYPAHKHVDCLKIFTESTWKSRNFIPILSVAIPHVNTSNNNLTIKIDDINFNATNPGVWCMNHTEATDSNRFTPWNEYEADMIISTNSPKIETKVYDDGSTATGPVPLPEKSPIEEIVEDVKNNNELGLDRKAKSALKSDPHLIEVTPKIAADAYAEGADKDPLSEEIEKKPKVKVK